MLRGLTVSLVFFLPTLALGWTPAAEERIALEAARLAPPDLRLLIEKYQWEYKQGVLRAVADEGNEGHRYAFSSRSGGLQLRLQHDVDAVIRMIQKGQPLRDVVEKLGVISHFVSDANNPFHLDDSDPRLEGCHADYEAWFEAQINKFPLVFYGLERNLLLPRYIDRMFARTAKYYPLMGEEFYRFGERRSTSEFDDRSTAFGVASISYSRAITDTVNLYYYVWRKAGGDVRSASELRRGTILLR